MKTLPMIFECCRCGVNRACGESEPRQIETSVAAGVEVYGPYCAPCAASTLRDGTKPGELAYTREER